MLVGINTLATGSRATWTGKRVTRVNFMLHSDNDFLTPGRTGVFRFSHGDTYEGGFLRGFMFGQGRYTWADGGYYEVCGASLAYYR